MDKTTTTTITPWRSLHLWCATNEYPGGDWVSVEHPGRVHPGRLLRALTEFRERGTIDGWYLANPADYPEDSDEVVNAGPSRDEVDWTGFDAS